MAAKKADDPTQREAARAKLVLAAIEMIEEHGLGSVTVRVLTDHAGVNVAAINYYFGSKANLVHAALRASLAHLTGDLDEAISRLDAKPRDGLRQILGYLEEGVRRYPNLTRAHLDVFFERGPSSPYGNLPTFAEALRPLHDALCRVLRDHGASEEAARQRAERTLAAVLFPGIFAGFFGPEDVPARERDLDALVEDTFRLD